MQSNRILVRLKIKHLCTDGMRLFHRALLEDGSHTIQRVQGADPSLQDDVALFFGLDRELSEEPFAHLPTISVGGP